jgi:hypothetical protein
MPAAMADTVEYYSEKIDKKEALEEPLKWDYDELVKLLAIKFVQLDYNARVNVSRGNPIDESGGGGGKICARCGDNGHYAGNRTPDGRLVCTSVCDECDSRMCNYCWRVPGAPGGPPCPGSIMADVMPAMETLTNAARHTYKKKVYDALVADRAKKRKAVGLKVSAARVADAATGDSDDGDALDQYHLF